MFIFSSWKFPYFTSSDIQVTFSFSHLLQEVGRVELGHDAVVAGGGQELVEGHGLAAEVVLQLDDINIGARSMINRARLSLAQTKPRPFNPNLPSKVVFIWCIQCYVRKHRR